MDFGQIGQYEQITLTNQTKMNRINYQRGLKTNIGRADRLGSGVRNLYKYSKYYSGEEPSFIEGDVFRIVVPLNDAYSFDFGTGTADKKSESADKMFDGKLPNLHFCCILYDVFLYHYYMAEK